MKQLRFMHLGDLHLDNDKKTLDKITASLDQVVTYCSEIKINAIIIPGDIWHKKQSYTANSGVPVLTYYLRQLSKLVDFIFITKGNHDDVGSINLLHQLEPNIYAYEYPVCLGVSDNFGMLDLLRAEEKFDKDEYDYIVSLVPYPTKSSFISEDSIDNNNANFIENFEQVFELIGEKTAEYSCPKILGFHGNVQGSRLSSGQTLNTQDIMVAPSTLEKAKADYYALNHIHLRQVIKSNMVYAGGIANFNWGETEDKSFELIIFTFDSPASGLHETEQIMLTSARPMMTVEAEFQPDDDSTGFKFTPDLMEEEYANAEVRFRCAVKENERKLLTDDKISWLKRYFGSDVKIEINIIPNERESRSEKIMHCKTLLDEVKEYAAVIGFEMNGTISEKVEKLQNKESEVMV